MTLDELNKLKSDAQKDESRSRSHKALQDRLAGIRNGDKPLMAAYGDLNSWGDDPEIKASIERVINEHGADLLRIAEMRQEAISRSCAASARQKQAALAEFMGDAA